MNSLDIVIVNHNSTDHLLRCLESVTTSLRDLPAQIYVQDNASTDHAGRVVSAFPRVQFSQNTTNMGFAKAVNKALKQGSAPYVVLLNPDAYVKGNFFESILNYLENHHKTGIVGPKVLNDDGSVQGSARSFPNPLTALFGRSSLLSRWFPHNPITRRNVLTHMGDGSTLTEVDWVSGACMGIRREALDDVGLLDDRFFMYWEDADLCKRMWESGWKVVYFPQPSVVHYIGGSSSDKMHIRTVLEFHKSSYRLFDKHAKGVYRLALPLAIWGLALRFLFVLFVQQVRQVKTD